MPDSDEEFEADEELEKEIVSQSPASNQDQDFSNIKVTQDFEPIKTPNQTSFKEEITEPIKESGS
jgi:S-DNA-T family DNA segregation ATPase FtsK/SpoIIIE